MGLALASTLSMMGAGYRQQGSGFTPANEAIATRQDLVPKPKSMRVLTFFF